MILCLGLHHQQRKHSVLAVLLIDKSMVCDSGCVLRFWMYSSLRPFVLVLLYFCGFSDSADDASLELAQGINVYSA